MTASIPQAAAAQTALKRPTILIVDDEPSVRTFLNRLLLTENYNVVTASDGHEALRAVSADAPDVVLLDINLPEIDGFEVCRRIRRDAATRLTPIIMITGLRARNERVEGLEAGADDFLTKPVDTHELMARVRSLVRLKQYTDDLDSAGSILMTLSAMIEARDGYGDGHCSRMANHAMSVGRLLKLNDADLQHLYRGGFLHDIGMLAIPDTVLRKVGPLEPEEYELVKSHTVIGDSLCSNLRSLQAVRPIIRHHHERLDGSGYPDGLAGDDIPLLAQIISVVDVFEALTSRRPYQSPKRASEAIVILRHHAERGWRRHDLVEALAQVVRSSSSVAVG
jgi:putative two-component system response regulator